MKHVMHLVVLFFVITPAIASQLTLQDKAAALSEAAIGNLLPPLIFTDTEGRRIALTEFRGKPLLISLIYTGCTDVCPMIIQNLLPAIEIAQNALGQDRFNTITIGFDSQNDTPDRMRSFARAQGVDLPNWLFLSSDQSTVQKLADAVGFTIIPSAGGFEHMAQVSVIDTDGRLFQQILGGVFNPPVIVEPLKDLLFGERGSIMSVSGIAERIKLFCTVFNPNTGRYYFNYSLFIGIGIGLACLLLILFWLLREFSLSNRSRGGTQR